MGMSSNRASAWHMVPFTSVCSLLLKDGGRSLRMGLRKSHSERR